jgi:hypothetical protein
MNERMNDLSRKLSQYKTAKTVDTSLLVMSLTPTTPFRTLSSLCWIYSHLVSCWVDKNPQSLLKSFIRQRLLSSTVERETLLQRCIISLCIDCVWMIMTASAAVLHMESHVCIVRWREQQGEVEWEREGEEMGQFFPMGTVPPLFPVHIVNIYIYIPPLVNCSISSLLSSLSLMSACHTGCAVNLWDESAARKWRRILRVQSMHPVEVIH